MSLKSSGASGWLRSHPLHPFLFAAYPILALLAVNISELELSSALRPLALSLAVAGVVAGVSRLFQSDWRRIAILLTIGLILFYSYGHLYLLLKGVEFEGFFPFRHRTLLPVWIGLGALLYWYVLRKPLNLPAVTHGLNLVGILLLIMPSIQLLTSILQRSAPQAQAGALTLRTGETPPDIYYIILDGYGRSDILKEQFGHDNSDFLDSLREMGFYIAECSQSNYAQTQLSLASSLNFNYIDALSGRFVPGTDDRTGLDTLIKHSTVRQSLEAAGYKTVAFATGFLMSEQEDADYFLAPERDLGALNEFEYLLLETTLARLIQDSNRFGAVKSGSELYRERTLFALDKLDELAYIRNPKFVFVHLIVPHPPYVFGPTGGPIAAGQAGSTTSGNDVVLYRDQVIYISNRLKEIVPAILANSDTPPIILIQSDHGPTIPGSPSSRMKNLAAYHLPGKSAALYPSITPVNAFRVIFNAYFGQELPLLEDVSLFSSYETPFEFRVIPNTCGVDQ